jgi:hypothetical protein
MPLGACVLGLAPHSGWAAAVLLGGTPQHVQVLARERLVLCEATEPDSRQPYHALEALPLPEAHRRLAHFEARAGALASASLRALAERAVAAGAPLAAAGILDASGRGRADLAAILASHALIHAAEGNHFRAALAGACQSLGVSVTRLSRGQLEARAAAVLGRSPQQLADAVRALGAQVGAPWGADQKCAALLAWLLLAQHSAPA